MPARLKPLAQQTIVITGATSGHGLCAAKMAAGRGARVMLAARDEQALQEACGEIRAKGGTAEFVVTDVADRAQVERLAEETIARFGGYDTWVNNAGVGIYGELMKIPIEDHRELFETNYWGLVYGSMVAVRHLKTRPGGGALINVGSINGDMPSPVIGAYTASKHAVKGFTDSLRIELMKEHAPISVTLIKPAAIGTPFPQHGRNLTGYKAQLPRPMYAPDVAARAILDAAEHDRRSITVGGIGKVQVLGATMLPRVFDRIAVSMADALVDRSKPIGYKEGNLEEPTGDEPRVEGRQHGRHFSTFNMAGRNPVAALATMSALAVGGMLALRGGRD